MGPQNMQDLLAANVANTWIASNGKIPLTVIVHTAGLDPGLYRCKLRFLWRDR